MTPSDRTEANRLDRDIVQRCRGGEVGAFEELYKRFGSRLYTVAYRMTGSAADAEDLLQDIFLQVYRRLGTFRGEAALGTWLHRIAVNTCLDFVRSKQGRRRRVTDTGVLSMIGLLDRPTKGSVFIDGVEVTKATDSEAPKIRREKIGFVFQHFNLIPTLSAFENVDIAMRFARVPKSKRKERATMDLLTRMGLRDRMNHKPSELSGGEQQRVAIARAMANNPAIILADEPTGEVDTKTRDMIVELLRGLSEKGQTILIVTHDTSVSARTKRIIKMLDGKIESDTINTVGEIKTA